MPSALETLVKILRLEREQGCKNQAVIGGLGAYTKNWTDNAHKQARRPEHHKLVEELTVLLQGYEEIESKTLRADSIGYMLDRIMGRVSPPPEYQVEDDAESESTDGDSTSPPESSKAEESTVQVDGGGDAVKVDDTDDMPDGNEAPVSSAAVADSSAQDAEDADDDESSSDGLGSKPRRRETSSRGSARRLDLPDEPRLTRPPRRPPKEIDPQEATDIIRGLSAEVETVRGVGPRLAKTLEKLDIFTINDLLFYLPRRYDDYTRLDYISKLQPDMLVTVIGSIKFTQVRVGRNDRKDFYMELDDGSGVLSVMFFGQHYLSRPLRVGKQVVLRGRTSIFRNRLQMANPEWEELDADNLQNVGIVPVYSLTEGLTPKRLRRLMQETVDYWADRLPDYVPYATLDRAELGDLGWTIRNLHFPEGVDHLGHARRRFIFDQLLLLQLAILANRRDWQSVPGHALEVQDEFLENFIEMVFEFPLTGAQRRAVEDIRRDISQPRPMNRLLQGDVGSGKTAVAVTAMAMAVANGKQAALMAPTSILAEQHYRGITNSLEKMPGERKPVVALLTSALTTTEREAVYNGLADGSIDIVIGTHAIIQEGVTFNDLALAVIDEQHRFGVEQRGTLRGKSTNPHMLVMTATPIPRTLALTIYADLDLSVMDEMPPGRVPIQTRIVRPVDRERMYGFVEKQLETGRQAFIVHPLVEASETIDARSATEAFEELSQVFYNYRVGLLHGRMRPAEKDDIMAAFSNHEFDVLVTTSVAEVGVDIPNASVIVIEGANRFGLAQLHQFRGRVGRGQFASYCLLVPDHEGDEAMERLTAMEKTLDGFKLAEIDWNQRGAGDLVGTRQSGRNALKIMEFLTPDLVELAQREARTIYEEDPYLDQEQHHLLSERVAMLYREETDVS